MRTIKLIDMTLRETGAIRDNTLSFKEKLEIARILDRLKADVIELPPLSGSKADQLSNKTIASAVKTGLSAAIEIAGGSKTTFDFNGGGVVGHLTVNNSTIYANPQHTKRRPCWN